MAFTVSGLSTYTKKANELFTEGVLLDDKFEQFETIMGIQATQYINFQDTDPVIQAATCGLTASGGTAYTERTVSVTNLKIQQQYCWDQLIGYGLVDDTQIAAKITEETNQKLSQSIEQILWQGNTTPAMSGWTQYLRADADINTLSGSAAITQANVLGLITGMTALITDRMRARYPLSLYVSNSIFDMYKKAVYAQNYYMDKDLDLGLNELWLSDYPKQIKIVGTAGLTGVDDMYLTWPKNLIIGRDELTHQASMKWVDDTINDYSYLKANWKIGASYKYADEAIVYKYIS